MANSPTPRTLRCRTCGRGPSFTKDGALERTGVCSPCTERAAKDASLGVGHIWTAVDCPAYRTLDGADCTCNNNERK